MLRVHLIAIHGASPYSYPNLANDVRAGSQILVADGSISLEVLSTDPASGTVQCRCLNTAMLGYVEFLF